MGIQLTHQCHRNQKVNDFAAKFPTEVERKAAMAMFAFIKDTYPHLLEELKGELVWEKEE